MLASVSTWSAHESLLSGALPVSDFVRLIAREGAGGMEIVDIDFPAPTLNFLRGAQRAGLDQGVKITCLSIEHNLCRPTAAERRADADKVVAWMEVSKARAWTPCGCSPDGR